MRKQNSFQFKPKQCHEEVSITSDEFSYSLENNTSPTKKDTLPPHFSPDPNIPRETGYDSTDLSLTTENDKVAFVDITIVKTYQEIYVLSYEL